METLKSVKLNSSAKDSKDRLLEKVRQLLEEITGSSSGQLDSSASGGSHKISGGEGETLKTKFWLEKLFSKFSADLCGIVNQKRHECFWRNSFLQRLFEFL